MAVGRSPTDPSCSASSPTATTVCANQNPTPVDLWTTLRVANRVHRRNSNSSRAEQNQKCVTHVPGQNCYLCRRLLRVRGFGRTRKTSTSEPPHPRSPRSLDLSPLGRGELRCPRQARRPDRVEGAPQGGGTHARAIPPWPACSAPA